MNDLRNLARSVLLAFADLGVYLPSHRDPLLRKMRSLEPFAAEQRAGFLGLCVAAGLLDEAEAGRLQLHPHEARLLAASMDGHTPVPDDQASAWAARLEGPSPA